VEAFLARALGEIESRALETGNIRELG
jgi:hypothetical protein